MIKITAEITIYDIDEGADFDAATPEEEKKSNVSSELSGVISETAQTKSLFTLAGRSGNSVVGGTPLDSGYIYSPTSVGYYISSISSVGEQEDGGYAIASHTVSDEEVNYLTITITATGLKSFTIVFDKQNNGYATKLSYRSDVSGYETKTIINDNATVTILDFDETAETHYIYIESWNKPYSSVIITSLYTSLTYTIDESRMMNCEFELREKADATLPCFGVISNSGSVEFKDYDGKFSAMIDDGALLENKKVTFYLENTYNKTKQAISTFLTESVDYDEDNATCNISCVDNLVALQDIKDIRIYLQKEYYTTGTGSNFRYVETKKTMLDVYNTLVSITNSLTDNKYQFDSLNEEVSSYLSNIILDNFFMKKDTVWAQWQKFCEATGLYMYINGSNEIIVSGEYDFSIGV